MLSALSSHTRSADRELADVQALDGGEGFGGVGRGYGSISLVLISFSGGECSIRGRREILLKWTVSRLLLNAPSANRTLARADEEVWNVRWWLKFLIAAVRTKQGSLADDIANVQLY